MMINTPSAPGGVAVAPGALPGAAAGDASLGALVAPAERGAAAAAEGSGLPALFAQMLDLAGVAAIPGQAAVQAEGAEPADQAADAETTDAQADTGLPLMAMMTALPFAALSTVRTSAAGPADAGAQAAGTPFAGLPAPGGTLPGDPGAAQARAATLLGAATMAATGTPLAGRLLQAVMPAAAEAPQAGAEARQPVASAGAGAATPGGTSVPATLLAAQDGAAQSGTEGQSGQPQGEGQATFRGVMAASAPAGAGAADTVKLAGTPEQWQQPLRAALGDRLQVTLQKGNDQAVNQAVIRLEPPNLGSIEISIRQTAGSLHVSMSATNSEVVRQLNAVGDAMRQDLSQRQQGDVAVTVSQASSRSLADSEGRGRQPEREAEQQRDQRGPGRALNEGDDTNTTFAMLRE